MKIDLAVPVFVPSAHMDLFAVDVSNSEMIEISIAYASAAARWEEKR